MLSTELVGKESNPREDSTSGGSPSPHSSTSFGNDSDGDISSFGVISSESTTSGTNAIRQASPIVLLTPTPASPLLLLEENMKSMLRTVVASTRKHLCLYGWQCYNSNACGWWTEQRQSKVNVENNEYVHQQPLLPHNPSHILQFAISCAFLERYSKGSGSCISVSSDQFIQGLHNYLISGLSIHPLPNKNIVSGTYNATELIAKKYLDSEEIKQSNELPRINKGLFIAAAIALGYSLSATLLLKNGCKGPDILLRCTGALNSAVNRDSIAKSIPIEKRKDTVTALEFLRSTNTTPPATLTAVPLAIPPAYPSGVPITFIPAKIPSKVSSRLPLLSRAPTNPTLLDINPIYAHKEIRSEAMSTYLFMAHGRPLSPPPTRPVPQRKNIIHHRSRSLDGKELY